MAATGASPPGARLRAGVHCHGDQRSIRCPVVRHRLEDSRARATHRLSRAPGGSAWHSSLGWKRCCSTRRVPGETLSSEALASERGSWRSCGDDCGPQRRPMGQLRGHPAGGPRGVVHGLFPPTRRCQTGEAGGARDESAGGEQASSVAADEARSHCAGTHSFARSPVAGRRQGEDRLLRCVGCQYAAVLAALTEFPPPLCHGGPGRRPGDRPELGERGVQWKRV
mmetsp:Transcript_51507/g.142576  ORF Transcript_51507/g.142576 Transcript_51507/m.142576 type:complete len:225 (-) Transcript_51507:9-683(-)